MIQLTKRQIEVLKLMANGEELVQDRTGRGWPQFWIGDNQTSGKIWKALVENVLISTHEDFAAAVVYWYINESGQRYLRGETKIYPVGQMDGSTKLMENWR